MENATNDQAGTAEGNLVAASLGQFEQLGNTLAAKHSATSNGTRRGGRKTAAEETADYLARNGMRAVPVNTGDDPGFTEDFQSADAPPAGPAGESGQAYVVTPEFIKTCAQTLFEGIEESRKRKVFLAVEKLDPSLSAELSEQAGAPPGAINVMSLSCAEITRKYDWASKCGPEGVLCGAILFWIFKDRQLQKKLSQLAKLKGAYEPADDGHTPPPQAPSRRNDE